MEVFKTASYGPKIKCSQCGCDIEDRIDQLMGVCSDIRCRGPYLAKKKKERETALRVAHQATIDKACDLVNGVLDQSLSCVVQECATSGRIAKVPSCDEELTELPKERAQAFREHLRQVLQKAEALLADPRAIQSVLTEYSHRDWEREKPPILPVLNGCHTCRGYCCRNGGDKAFLTPEQMAWQLLSDPTVTIESLEMWFLMALPQMSIDDSCVFHTTHGCALPRNQRATICNDFHCWELQDQLAKYQDGQEVAWTSIASTDGAVFRMGIVAPGRERVEIDLSSQSIELEVEG